MPTYVFHLHDGASVKPREEILDAADLCEARDLAEMRLLFSTRFTHIEVFQDGEEKLQLVRDGRHRRVRRLAGETGC